METPSPPPFHSQGSGGVGLWEERDSVSGCAVRWASARCWARRAVVDAALREVAARRELDAERAARADDALQAAQRLHDREAQLRHEADSRRRADAEALAEERRRRGDAENRLREWKARAAQVTQLARRRVARLGIVFVDATAFPTQREYAKEPNNQKGKLFSKKE